MRDSARILAVIDLVGECEASWQGAHPLPADGLLNRYFRARRYIGAKDRGAISELFYYVIRKRAALQWWCERQGVAGPRALVIAALMLRRDAGNLAALQALFAQDRPHSPDALSAGEIAFALALTGASLRCGDMPLSARLNFSSWLEADLRHSLGDAWEEEIIALDREAPVDLRVNAWLTTREILIEELRKEGYHVEETPFSPLGIRLKKRAPIFTSPCFKQGWFEMQDEGSQLVSLLAPVKPGDKVIDFCAGAGGKTLALAARMRNKGRILAWDVSQKRLDQMTPRLARARVDNVQRRALSTERDPFIKRHLDSAHLVVIDAPCSGSGTWRRNPDIKWRFNQEGLAELCDLQRRILESAARLVKPGGYLLYITCSLLESENGQTVAGFLAQHGNFAVARMENLCSNLPPSATRQASELRLSPHKSGTDGFYACLMQRSD